MRKYILPPFPSKASGRFWHRWLATLYSSGCTTGEICSLTADFFALFFRRPGER